MQKSTAAKRPTLFLTFTATYNLHTPKHINTNKMASKPTEMCVIETTGAHEYKVRMNSSLLMTIMTSVSLSLDLFLTQTRDG